MLNIKYSAYKSTRTTGQAKRMSRRGNSYLMLLVLMPVLNAKHE